MIGAGVIAETGGSGSEGNDGRATAATGDERRLEAAWADAAAMVVALGVSWMEAKIEQKR